LVLAVVILCLLFVVLRLARPERPRVVPPAPPSTFSNYPGSMESQRDKMRSLYDALGGDEERVVAAYAASEKAGEVQRKSNDYGLNADAYARRLLADGIAKKWINQKSA